MKTLVFENRDINKVFFNDKPIDLHRNIYMFKWMGKIFKLVQYSEHGFTWLNIFDNGHWFLPNGRTETLDEALNAVKKHDIKMFDCRDKKEICEFINTY